MNFFWRLVKMGCMKHLRPRTMSWSMHMQESTWICWRSITMWAECQRWYRLILIPMICMKFVRSRTIFSRTMRKISASMLPKRLFRVLWWSGIQFRHNWRRKTESSCTVRCVKEHGLKILSLQYSGSKMQDWFWEATGYQSRIFHLLHIWRWTVSRCSCLMWDY